MNHHIKIDFELQFASKWHAGNGEGNLMCDRLIRRNSRNFPYIPASTLKGVIRQNCEMISRTIGFPESHDPNSDMMPAKRSPVDMIFGNRFQESGLFFKNAASLSDTQYQDSIVIARTCRYRILGTTRDKHLFSSEYAEPSLFSTSVEGYHRDLKVLEKTDPPFSYVLLLAGISMLERLGGDKSTGCGQFEYVHFNSVLYNNVQMKDSMEDLFVLLDPEFYEDTQE